MVGAGGPEEDTGDGEEFLSPEDVTWSDYVALTIALAQTVLLPFLLASAVLFVLFILSLFLL